MKKSETVSGDEDTVLRPYRYCNPLVVPGCSVDKKEDELDKQSEQVKKTNSGSEKVTKWSKNEELSNVSENEELDNTSQNKDFVELLPSEMVCKVAEFLTTQDLSACCGVSRSWRDVFNLDCFWRKHCDSSHEEYLRITPCEVEPVFVSPERDNSSLSPAGRLRLSFLRENHLYKNWGCANYRTTLVADIDDVEEGDTRFFSYGFLGNDHVVVINRDGCIDVWRLSVDMKSRSAVKCLPNFRYESVNVGLGLLVSFSGVHVITLDETATDVTNKHLFFFDDSQKIVENDFSLFKHLYMLKRGNSQEFPSFQNEVFAVVGTVFIGGLPSISSSLHVWDLEGGIKLTEEKCPLAVKCTLLKVVHSRSSDYAAIVYQSRKHDDYTRDFILVYDPKKLTFLSFKQSYHSNKSGMGHFALHKEYIAIYQTEVEPMIDMYNVVSSEHIYHCLTGDSLFTVGVTDDSFVFNCQGITTLFNPTTKTISTIPGSSYVHEIGNEFLVLDMGEYFDNFSYVWRTKRSSVFKSLPDLGLFNCLLFGDFNFLNATCTRLLVCSNGEALYVRTFW